MLFCPKITIRELPALTVKDIVRIFELDFTENQGKTKILKKTCSSIPYDCGKTNQED